MTSPSLFLPHSNIPPVQFPHFIFQTCQLGQKIVSEYYDVISKVVGFPVSSPATKLQKTLSSGNLGWQVEVEI